MADSTPLEASATGTRAALIVAGIDLFGTKGFAATSTREIAGRAETNIASIAYHFGGKDGLRMACGEDFAQRLVGVIRNARDTPVDSPETARAELRAAFSRMIGFLLGQSGAAPLAKFILRELTDDSPVIDQIYAAFMEPAHKRLCGLWGLASGCPAESDEVRLSVFSFVGQVLYFRIGNRIVARRMGWAAVGPPELAQIETVLLANLDAMLAATGKVP